MSCLSIITCKRLKCCLQISKNKITRILNSEENSILKVPNQMAKSLLKHIKQMDKYWHIPDLVEAFSYVEHGGLNLVLKLAKPHSCIKFHIVNIPSDVSHVWSKTGPVWSVSVVPLCRIHSPYWYLLFTESEAHWHLSLSKLQYIFVALDPM